METGDGTALQPKDERQRHAILREASFFRLPGLIKALGVRQPPP